MQQFQGLSVYMILIYMQFWIFNVHSSCFPSIELVMHKLDFYAMDFYVLIRFSCSLAPEDGVAANEELAMQASMVSYAFLCISTCLPLRDGFYAIA
jgi:hypothetical protein